MSRKRAAAAVLGCAGLAFLVLHGMRRVPEPVRTVPEPAGARAVKPAQRAAQAPAVDVAPAPDLPEGSEPAAPFAAAPPPDPPGQPQRVLPDEEGGLTEESDRIWQNEKATALEIDRANMLDVCACPDPECVRSLQTRYYERKQRAPLGSPNPDEEDAVRVKRTECLLSLSRAAYEQKHASAATTGAR